MELGCINVQTHCSDSLVRMCKYNQQYRLDIDVSQLNVKPEPLKRDELIPLDSRGIGRRAGDMAALNVIIDIANKHRNNEVEKIQVKPPTP